jgi:hypothetical protein
VIGIKRLMIVDENLSDISLELDGKMNTIKTVSEFVGNIINCIESI